MTSIVVHYKELALKGKNRPWFIQLLVRNLKTALAGLHVASVRSSMGRIELELRPDSPWEDVRERLGRIFGVANFSYANHGPQDFRALADKILADVGGMNPVSFRVSATRSDKRLPFTSPQVEREVVCFAIALGRDRAILQQHFAVAHDRIEWGVQLLAHVR